MKSSADPAVHRDLERRFFEHVEKLLSDDRLRLPTTRGRKTVTSLIQRKTRSDHGSDLKRTMSEMGRRDRDLQERMPVGEYLNLELLRKRLWIFRSQVGRFRVISLPPTRPLLDGRAPAPLTRDEYAARIDVPVRAGHSPIPELLVVFSSSGFAPDMRAMTQEPGAYILLVEPNDAGGFVVTGPAREGELIELLDPEEQGAKRRRVVAAIEGQAGELAGSGVAADRLAERLQLPLQLVESEVKSYARERSGLAAKKLDGRLVLFRQGTLSPLDKTGGPAMPIGDRIRAIFRGDDDEKKIALLSERRTALMQQSDRGYEELAAMEKKEQELRQQFASATGELPKRRITSQLLQLRNDMARRQQTLSMLSTQINTVSAHLYNVELAKQGSGAAAINSEEMAADAARAEEVLAEMEATRDLASTTASANWGMSEDEKALREELEREVAAQQPTPQAVPPQQQASARASNPPSPASPQKAPPQRQPGEAEPG